MTGTSRTSDGLEPRRKRLLFRSWHRGTREMDLLMGRFADAKVGVFDDADIEVFEALIEVPDRDLFAWIVKREAVPSNYDTAVFRQLQSFHTGG